ncbi:MAG: type III polyketide synthase [Geobacteraceae bacterium]|nr:type III polyketide synthase [Geobacteraceae bacterium]
MKIAGSKRSSLEGGQGSVCIGSIAPVVPPYSADQAFAAEFMREHFREKLSSRSLGLIRATFSHPSIRKRHFALDDPACIVGESPDQRIARFTEKSIELSGQAVTRALEQAGVTIQEVRGLVVNTCTGYICPGISTYLIERLGLSRSTRVYDLVGSGCGGAIPNLQVAEAMLRTNGGDGVVVSVSVEICSSTFQMDNDLSLILSNALFGDGAAAAVLWDRPVGFELVASAGRYVPEQRDAIRFVHKDGELHNQLSLKLPDLVRKTAAEVVADVLSAQGLHTEDVRHWALHTGGEKIINAVRDEIGIPEERLRATRKVLAEYGNMSSPTVWFVLDEIRQEGIAAGDWCVMVAFGAGLSAHAFLLREK